LHQQPVVILCSLVMSRSSFVRHRLRPVPTYLHNPGLRRPLDARGLKQNPGFYFLAFLPLFNFFASSPKSGTSLALWMLSCAIFTATPSCSIRIVAPSTAGIGP